MQFDMTRAWNDAVARISANREVLLIVAGLFFFLPYVVFMLMLPGAAAMIPSGGATDPQEASRILLSFYGKIWWIVLLLLVAQSIGTLALFSLLTDHRRPTVGDALKFGLIALLPFLGMQILQSLVLVFALGIPLGAAIASQSTAAIVLVATAAIVAMAYLLTKFSLGTAVMAREHVLNPVAALTRSWKLTKGNSLRIFLFYFLLGVVAVVVSMVVSTVVSLVLMLLGTQAMLFGSALVSGLTNAVWVLLFLAVQAAIHGQLAGESPTSLNDTFS
ncbi:MAG: hypothetical protein J7496_04720 [Novosphingobium sp.]|nr:hypothetical protein [Novosphingobium sp.]